MTTFRFAGDNDVSELMSLINTAFGRAERFFIEGDRIDEEELKQYMSRGKFVLAEENATVAGCVYVELRGERGYVGLLSVEPQRQGSGLGKRLMAEAEEYFRKNGCCAVDIRVVNLRTELMPFYRALGYREVGVEPFPCDLTTLHPCHLVLMSKAL
ncbi:MAG TPA: GNAT family N-acetyltransferase [Terriglobales bacterium]|nr:GNAT family N-acetyltransferase [Terriglobales bacterium]